jgi:alkylation response protein AidB-like acyl-CoA dehydrogenase
MQFDPDAFAADSLASFDELYPVLGALRPHDKRAVSDCEWVFDTARRLRREVIEPRALAVESAVRRDPGHVATEVLAAAGRERWFSMLIPKMFGGMGLSFGALMIGLEEISAGCVGLANLIAVHGLAVSTVAGSGDLGNLERVARMLCESEANGSPTLLSTAITEPGAGTDVEDVDLLRTARLECVAEPVPGGYLLSGRKVFISNGSIAHTHVVIMPTDRKRPVETSFGFLVPADSEGLSIGRVERKMGQKACPAAELVFDRCFVPEERRLGRRPLPGRRVDLVLGATRGGVGAFGAGVARGAFERARHYARTHRLGGYWLIDQQWVQVKLADMQRNVMAARAAYLEALFSNELYGLASLLSGGALKRLQRHLPRKLLDSAPVHALLRSRPVREQAAGAAEELGTWQADTASAYGAAAKVTGTDLGLCNCELALDICGADGLRHDLGVEKLYRDAKLLQIYEGTNQLNRIELYKKAVVRGGVPAPPADPARPAAPPPRPEAAE